MFAPNRFLTAKEQWLLLGIIVAVVTGSVTLYIHGRSQARTDDPFIILGNSSTPAPLKSPDKNTRVSSAVPPSTPAFPVQPPATVPTVPSVDTSQPNTRASEKTIPEIDVTPVSETIGVAIMGAVEKPGLYMLPDTKRVADLIALAGGATHEADLSEISLTATLIDETTLTIPEKPVQLVEGSQLSARRGAVPHLLNPAPYLKHPPRFTGEAVPFFGTQTPHGEPTNTASPAPPTGQSGSALINVNQATEAQLQQLPGIGAALSAAIIAERERQPFANVNDLDRVPGIGEKRLAAIRQLVTAP